MKKSRVSTFVVSAALFAGVCTMQMPAHAQVPDLSELPTLQEPAAQDASASRGMFLREIRLQGNTLLTTKEVERAVYPYLGPGRSETDVEKARVALQKLYYEKGYQTVSVSIPQQKVRRGVVVLKVDEVTIGKVRIRGAEYHELDEIRRRLPALSEGTVPNFNEVMQEVVALNRSSELTVDPTLVPGSEPNTFDVDLSVKDTLPLYGGIELNNRNSANTTALRLNGSISYDNLWQAHNSIGGSFQISPEEISEVKVFSGYYRARFNGLERFSLMLSGTSQDSNVSTLGGVTSAGAGYTIGLLASYELPSAGRYYQSVNLSVDYKHSTQETTPWGAAYYESVPIDYMPVTLSYSGNWFGEDESVNLFLSFTTNIRAVGSNTDEWELNRIGASGNFTVLRGSVSYTAKLIEHLEGYWRLHGQFSDSPLITAEQSAGGGLDSVRGYYEGEILGDQSLFGTFEVRSDILSNMFQSVVGDGYANVFLFTDGGILNRRSPLPEEKSYQYMASFGMGARLGLLKYLSGSVNLGVPVIDGIETQAWHPRVIFVIRGDF